MATRVEFHTGVSDPLDFACRLLRKAYRQGVRVLVTAPEPMLTQLDEHLWTFVEQEFIPHLRWRSSTAEAGARTPIWLVEGAPPPASPQVLLNLGAAAVARPADFERLIEIIADDQDEVLAGRARWRAYEAFGLQIEHHRATPPT